MKYLVLCIAICIYTLTAAQQYPTLPCNTIINLENDPATNPSAVDTFNLSGLLLCPGPKRLIIDFFNFEIADSYEVIVTRPNGITHSLKTAYIGAPAPTVPGDTIFQLFRDYTMYYNGDPGLRTRQVPPANFSLPLSYDPNIGMGRITVLTTSDSIRLVLHYHPSSESNTTLNIVCDNDFEVLGRDTVYLCEPPVLPSSYRIAANCDTLYVDSVFVGQTLLPDTLYIEDDNLAPDTIASGYINFFGCEIIDEILIFIPEPVPPEPTKKEIYVPNVFSPNWDGVNDVWTIDSATHILVVDRRSNRVFSCDSDTDCARGWGPYLPEIPAGVYLFYARVRHRGQLVQLRGDVTLVR